ncbi:hypothetical protein CEXT_137891 [Caerostris extrusa]|uniref:Uncharacterized protein n=1 Tax=Caerostris extrusa TaxID=172846 RepID=A0AAV4P7G4_CAEEX|nr:hypothetical protein CEXT_137891 [Caerostris extrusa]
MWKMRRKRGWDSYCEEGRGWWGGVGRKRWPLRSHSLVAASAPCLMPPNAISILVQAESQTPLPCSTHYFFVLGDSVLGGAFAIISLFSIHPPPPLFTVAAIAAEETEKG